MIRSQYVFHALTVSFCLVAIAASNIAKANEIAVRKLKFKHFSPDYCIPFQSDRFSEELSKQVPKEELTGNHYYVYVSGNQYGTGGFVRMTNSSPAEPEKSQINTFVLCAANSEAAEWNNKGEVAEDKLQAEAMQVTERCKADNLKSYKCDCLSNAYVEYKQNSVTKGSTIDDFFWRSVPSLSQCYNLGPTLYTQQYPQYWKGVGTSITEPVPTRYYLKKFIHAGGSETRYKDYVMCEMNNLADCMVKNKSIRRNASCPQDIKSECLTNPRYDPNSEVSRYILNAEAEKLRQYQETEKRIKLRQQTQAKYDESIAQCDKLAPDVGFLYDPSIEVDLVYQEAKKIVSCYQKASNEFEDTPAKIHRHANNNNKGTLVAYIEFYEGRNKLLSDLETHLDSCLEDSNTDRANCIQKTCGQANDMGQNGFPIGKEYLAKVKNTCKKHQAKLERLLIEQQQLLADKELQLKKIQVETRKCVLTQPVNSECVLKTCKTPFQQGSSHPLYRFCQSELAEAKRLESNFAHVNKLVGQQSQPSAQDVENRKIQAETQRCVLPHAPSSACVLESCKTPFKQGSRHSLYQYCQAKLAEAQRLESYKKQSSLRSGQSNSATDRSKSSQTQMNPMQDVVECTQKVKSQYSEVAMTTDLYFKMSQEIQACTIGNR